MDDWDYTHHIKYFRGSNIDIFEKKNLKTNSPPPINIIPLISFSQLYNIKSIQFDSKIVKRNLRAISSKRHTNQTEKCGGAILIS